MWFSSSVPAFASTLPCFIVIRNEFVRVSRVEILCIVTAAGPIHFSVSLFFFFFLIFFYVFIVWYKCYYQWDQPGYFCGGSGKYFGQNQIISVCRPIKKIWRCCVDKAKSVTVFHRRKPAHVKAGKTLSPYQNIHWLEYLCQQYTDASHVYAISSCTFGQSVLIG